MDINIKYIHALHYLAPKKDPRKYLISVHVKASEGKILYEATDGHVIGRIVDDYDGEPFELLIPVEVAKQLKPVMHGMGTLTQSGDTWIIDDLSGSQRVFKSVEGVYPDIKDTFSRLIGTDAPSGIAAQFDVDLLVNLAKVNKALGAKYPGQIKLHHNGPENAARVELSDPAFTGIIMPVRL